MSNCACSASPEVSSSSFVPPLVALKGLNLQLIQENGELAQQQVPSESLWQDQDCLIYLVRRPGCILCRNKARELQEIRDQLNERGVRMAAVVHEELGVEEFRRGFWCNGDAIYLNSDRSLFAAINPDRKVAKQSLLKGLLSMDMWKRIRQAKNSGVEGNLAGEGKILGGILLMSPKSGTKWCRNEKSFGDHASNEEILAATTI